MELGPDVKKHQEHQPSLEGRTDGRGGGDEAARGNDWGGGKGTGMSFCKGEKGSVKGGPEKESWGRAENEEETGPSIHTLGFWGNLAS